ncbi:hypothetical protein DAT35_26350 [Vitiosangium sp. GDMCC 1.1324]|nr:hypothetical protein DAT35_26350 [Vitiosangium sp. GDMCC 1.1324]
MAHGGGVNMPCHGYTGGVSSHQGRVLTDPRIIAVFWDPAFTISSPLVGSMSLLLTDVLSGSFVKGLQEYEVGVGSSIGVHIIDTKKYPPPSKIDAGGIQSQLAKWLDDGAVTPKPDAHEGRKVYVVFTPSSTSISDGVGACGYHNHGSYGPGGSDNLIWAAIFGYAGSTSADGVAFCVGHELAETFTNPTDQGYFVDTGDSRCEIGDLCEAAKGSSKIISYPYLGWNVEPFWSQASTACIKPGGTLFHTLRRANGAWPFPFGNVEAQLSNNLGNVFRAACALNAKGELHVCAIDGSGNVWHTIRAADGTWPLPWEDVEKQTSWKGGPIPRVACSVDATGNLHVCAIDRNGKLWHTIRTANGTWPFAFGDVQAQTTKVRRNSGIGPTPHVACSTNAAGDLHVCAIDVNGGLWHTIRKADGTWPFAFGDVQAQTRRVGPNIGPTPYVACSADPSGDLHVVVVDLNGGLRHTIRKNDGSWPFAFGDVLAVTKAAVPKVCAQLATRLRVLENFFQHVHDPAAMQKLAQEIAAVVKQQEENDCNQPNAISNVACAAQGIGELHVCAVDLNGILLHASRLSNGSWTSFESVQRHTILVGPKQSIGMTPSVACSTTGALDLHICAIS